MDLLRESVDQRETPAGLDRGDAILAVGLALGGGGVGGGGGSQLPPDNVCVPATPWSERGTV